MTREDFVTYNQAIQLKGFGFDCECYYFYHFYIDKRVLWTYTSMGYGDDCRNWNDKDNATIADALCSAPTLAQAQKWLREVKGIIISITPKFYQGRMPLLGYDYNLFNKDGGEYSHIESKSIYDTYEEALSAGIDKVIKLLKEENNETLDSKK